MDNTAGAGIGGQQGDRLDASGDREVVFCHQCDNEWWQDEHGLVCPRCQGEIIEIVDIESDPRPLIRRPVTPPEIQALRNHNPWDGAQDSDPDEMDIEEHVSHDANGTLRFTRTVRTHPFQLGSESGTRRNPIHVPDRTPRAPWQEFGDANNSEHVMRNFQDMIGDLVGPQLRHGQAGRSGPETLYRAADGTDVGPFPAMGGFRVGGNGGTTLYGGRVTYTTGEGSRIQNFGRARNGPAGAQDGLPDLSAYDPPLSSTPLEDLPSTYPDPSSNFPDDPPSPVDVDDRPVHTIRLRIRPDQVPSILGGLFGGGPDPLPGEDPIPGLPPGLQGLFRAMMDPANARSGDAVYTQEALDQIISTLMDQHTTSNAPGPASPSAIAALPKKKLGEKELGPEGKGECSVCMDDVKVGDEVVSLPCAHWFHEQCAGMWLGEHNTCPICRKGIEGDAPASSTPNEPSRRASAVPSSGAGSAMNRGEITRGQSLGQQRASARDESAWGGIAAGARTESARNEWVRNLTGGENSRNDAQARNAAESDLIRNMATSGDSGDVAAPRVPRGTRPATGRSSGSDVDMPGAFSRRDNERSNGGGESGSPETREERRERRTMSRRSSQSGNSGNGAAGNGGGGMTGWFSRRFGGGGGEER